MRIPIYNEEDKLIGYCSAEIRPIDWPEIVMPAEIDTEGIEKFIPYLHHWNSTDSAYDFNRLLESFESEYERTKKTDGESSPESG